MSGLHTLLMLCSNDDLSHLTVIVKLKFIVLTFSFYLFNQEPFGLKINYCHNDVKI